jgi:hypothetical protein
MPSVTLWKDSYAYLHTPLHFLTLPEPLMSEPLRSRPVTTPQLSHKVKGYRLSCSSRFRLLNATRGLPD